MYKDMPDMFSQMDVFMAPMVKTNKLFVANLEKLMVFQMSAVSNYMDMMLSQAKAAAEISSVQELQNYMSKSMEFYGALPRKMMDDAKTLNDLGNGMKNELSKLAEENVSDFTKSAKTTAKKAAA